LDICRADLSPADRAKATRRRKEIYEEMHPETRAHVAGAHGSNRSQGNASANIAPAFTPETASISGKSERIVQLDAERGKKISEQALDKLRGTKLNSDLRDDPQQIARAATSKARKRLPRARLASSQPSFQASCATVDKAGL
jgi:hypothetical protein